MLRVSLSEVKPIVKTLRNSKANTKFANKAGNSIVVDVLMAIFKEMM